jgi:tripartite-type tricarboxylate transporter receptor subunit TctC
MNLPRRTFLRLTVGAVALPAASRIACAQGYPTRPVRLIVGYPPAGTTDVHARVIAPWLSERLGQQFVVENRSGAGGNIAAEAVVRAAPDGYTLLQATGSDSWNASLYSNLKFNFVRDTTPVASLARGIGVLVAHPTVQPRSVAELIAYARLNPGKFAVASGGVGSAPHIFWELFRTMTGVEMLHVPYRGAAPALTDLLAGQVQIMFTTLVASIEYIRSDRLRALAVTSTTRSELLPDVPAVSEFVPGYEAIGWQGLVAPRNTPREIVEKLNSEVNAALADSKIKARFADLGSSPLISSSAEFGRFIAEFTEKWAKVIRAAGIKPE